MIRVSSFSPFGATLMLALAAAAVAIPAAQAQSSVSPAIYPALGQNARQQDKDKYECYAWARRQTGFDPAAASAQAAQAQMPPGPGNLLRGAMGGAAIGELAHDDPGQGAAVGVLGAAVRQRVKQQQQAAAQSQQRAGYERAFGACLQGRGYTVR